MWYFIFAAVIVALDRAVKLWVMWAVEPGTAFPLIPGIIHITNVENPGAAFSILANMRWVLVGVSSVCALAIIYIIAAKKLTGFGRWCAAAILGGAVGNLIDRILTGKVLDMFETEFVTFAIFNVADIFITLGGAALIIYIITFEMSKKTHTIADDNNT
ncbi:MAG: signal peptidase II [Oscillospiraceae bacterium]|jgi:signal peptidase II|nr:signal peptidase II [Oscillospiraceae bacterium]